MRDGKKKTIQTVCVTLGMAYGTRDRKGRQHAGAGATDGNRGGGVISKYAAIAWGGLRRRRRMRETL